MMKLTLRKYLARSISRYDVELPENTTVREFTNEVLKRKEWGEVHVRGSRPYMPDLLFEYKDDKILKYNHELVIRDRIIKEVYAEGGWTTMNYVITLK